MKERLRNSGIGVLGEVPWGTYFCQFHNSTDELLEILVPYFKAGLEGNEFCVWVVSPPLTAEVAIRSMRAVLPDFDRYIEKGQIELLDHAGWYLKDGVFDLNRVLRNWGEKLTGSLSKGFDGMRVTGDTAWVDKKDWTAFMEYENGHSADYPMIANCTYSLKRCSALDLIEVTAKHQFALVKAESGWKLVESSELRHAEEAIRDNERLLREIMDRSPSMIFIKDMEGRFITINRQMERLIGISREDIKGKTDFDIVPKEMAEYYREHDRQVRETGKAILFEEIDDSSEGKSVFLANKFPLFDSQGRMYGTCSISHDITERKRADTELEREKAYLEKLQNALADFVLAVKLPERTIEFVNAAVETMTGYRIDECIGRTTEFLHVDAQHYAEFGKWMEEVVREGGDVLKTEHIMRRKNGETFPIGVTVSFFRTDGVVTGLVSVIRDITEQKRAEELRIANQNRISREMLDAIPGIVYVFEEQGGLVRWNRNLELITGYDGEEIKNMRPLDLLYEGHRERGAGKTREGFTAGKVESEADLLTRDGRRIPYYFTSRRFEAEGKAYLVGVGVDLTERNRIESERQRTAKIESVGILAGGIAHDFNNLLTGIIANLSLAKESIGSPDTIERILTNAEKAAFRATGLTGQLLTFAKGGLPVKETADIADLIKDAARFALSGSNVKCEFAIPEDHYAVDVDRGQISQVISNLTINAVQAMPKGGVIDIRCENAEVAPGRVPDIAAGKYLRISIKDSGAGIPVEIIKKIFDPYFSTKQTGSGLGLAISYSIVRKHGGTIVAESEPGAGATFHVYLPASQAEVRTACEIEQKLAGHVQRRRILVVDDEDIIRDTIGQILGHKGHDVDFASDGTEAIEMYKKAMALGRPYDLLIMDLTIPGGMGGTAAIGKLLEIDPGVKAIVSSGYSKDPIMSDYRKYGFKDVIAKPYKVSELAETVCRVLSLDASGPSR
jgi:PAS domain S-box-containing protein